jgi:hypothetical protein
MPLVVILAALALAFAAALWFRPLAAFLPMPPGHGAGVWDRCRAFDDWDRSRRARNVFAGLKLFYSTSDGRIINLASRHWPHLLCWQWIVSWCRPFPGYEQQFFKLHREGPGLSGGESVTLHLLWLGYIHYRRQASDRMAALGRGHFDAPVIFPKLACAA